MSTQERVMKKIQDLRNLMLRDGLDGLVITHNIDQFYLLGFFFYPCETILLLTEKELVCFTRQLYVETLRKEFPFVRIVGLDKQRVAAAVKEAALLDLKRVGFDAEKESYMAGSLFKASGFVEAAGYIGVLRQVKDEYEISILRESNRIAYLACEYVKPLIKTGITEAEVAAEIEKFMRVQGASATSFQTIIAFGENTANPHHVTSQRKLNDNEAVLMDFGCVYNGYCSDITRSWWHGDQEPEEYTKIWNIVDKARKTGIETQAPGVAAQKVDAAARAIIASAGYGEYFTHRLGHGVGMDVHEEPCNDQTTPAILKKGNVLTVEPGIYLSGKYGVRLEDTTVITDTGAEILTRE